MLLGESLGKISPKKGSQSMNQSVSENLIFFTYRVGSIPDSFSTLPEARYSSLSTERKKVFFPMQDRMVLSDKRKKYRRGSFNFEYICVRIHLRVRSAVIFVSTELIPEIKRMHSRIKTPMVINR